VSTRIKVDEDLPGEIAGLLSAQGYDTATVAGEGISGAPDGVLWSRVQAENRWMITADKGFADLRRHPPGTHAGVVLVRLPEESRRAYVEVVGVALAQLHLDELVGAVVVVTPRGVRIRRPPPD